MPAEMRRCDSSVPRPRRSIHWLEWSTWYSTSLIAFAAIAARGGGLGGKADTAGANTSAKGAKLIRNCGIEDGSAVGLFDDQRAEASGGNQRHESTVDIFECLGMLDAFRQLVKEGRECLAPAGEVGYAEAI